jgi:regulator of ribonuclease activity A
MLEMPGEGNVLVVDGGGSLRCALVGGNLGKLAEGNGWAGIIVNGCVRDTLELDDCDVGVLALGTIPRRSERKGAGDKNVVVNMSGVLVHPGDMIYADEDGVLVSREAL